MARGWGITVVFGLAVAGLVTAVLFGVSLVRHAVLCQSTVVRSGETLAGLSWHIEEWSCGKGSRSIWSVRAGPPEQRMRLFLEATGGPEPVAVSQAGGSLTITVRHAQDNTLRAVPVGVTPAGEPVQVVRFLDGRLR